MKRDRDHRLTLSQMSAVRGLPHVGLGGREGEEPARVLPWRREQSEPWAHSPRPVPAQSFRAVLLRGARPGGPAALSPGCCETCSRERFLSRGAPSPRVAFITATDSLLPGEVSLGHHMASPCTGLRQNVPFLSLAYGFLGKAECQAASFTQRYANEHWDSPSADKKSPSLDKSHPCPEPQFPQGCRRLV